jgi:hypothetical protein
MKEHSRGIKIIATGRYLYKDELLTFLFKVSNVTFKITFFGPDGV